MCSVTHTLNKHMDIKVEETDHRSNCKQQVPYFFGYKFFLPKQSQRSRSVLQDGSRSLGLFRKGKIGITATFHRTD